MAILSPDNESLRLSSRDNDDTRSIERQLLEAERRFRDYVDYSLALFCTHDLQGNLLSVNRAAAESLGYAPEELIGRNLSEFLPAESRAAALEYFERIKHQERSKGLMSIVAKSGEERIWAFNNVRRTDADGLDYILGCAQDITELKRKEEELKAARDAALESARLKSAFLTNVSHEIRTPMNGVIGMIELLLDTPLDRAQREYAETIRQSSDALLTVINDILDLAKIESGKLRFENVDFDVRETVESTVEMLAERAFRKNIEIASLVAADVPQILSGDPGRLRQVLTNLIGNAVKFTERGEIGIWVKVERETEKNLVLSFTVTDTGIGISREDLKNLFQPFVQVDNSTKRQYGGTGLGLAISKQIVEMMNGNISVESQPQVGSKFSFTAFFTKNTKSAESETAQPSLSQLLKGKKILIADASPIICQTLKQYCSVWEMNAVEAADGEDALRKLHRAVETDNPFDIAVIDMNLPDWEGFSLARKIKSDDILANTNVVLTTVFGQRGDGATAQEIGVAAYLTKPIRGSQLFDCLTTVLRENRASQEKDEEKVSSLITRHSLRERKARAESVSISFGDQTFPVLVAEDNEINRRLIIKQLEQIGIKSDLAIDGVEALEKIATNSYKLVLMDCQMPRLDGYETTREIRRAEKAKAAAGEPFSPLIVVALTAHTLAGEREKCLAAGMNDYLSKPVKIKDLAAMLQFWSDFVKNESEFSPNAEAKDSENDQFCLTSSEKRRPPFKFLQDETINKEFAAEIFNLFLTETEKRLDRLKSAADEKNGAAIAQIAHAIRGNALVIGADSIACLTRQIEEAGKQNDFEKTVETIGKLVDEFYLLQSS